MTPLWGQPGPSVHVAQGTLVVLKYQHLTELQSEPQILYKCESHLHFSNIY